MRGIIMEVFKDQKPPRAYLEQVFKDIKVRNVGIATVDASEGLLSQHTSGEPTIEGVEAMVEACNGCALILGEYKDGTLDSDYQPSILLSDEKDKPLILGMMIGQYPGYDKNDSHTPEHHAAHEYLFPKINEFYEIAEGDIDKLIGMLNKKTVTADIHNLISGEGTVTLMFNNGKLLHYFKTSKNREYPWGRVSDHCGWAAEQIKTSVPEVKPMSALEKLKAAAAGKKVEAPPPKPEEHTVLHQDTTTDDKKSKGPYVFWNLFGGKPIPDHIGNKYPLYYPPVTVTQFRDVRKWAKNKSGIQLNDTEIKNRIGVFSRSDLAKIRLEMAAEEARAKGSDKVEVQPTAAEKLKAAAAKKDTVPKHVPESTVTYESSPFLSADIMKKLKPSLDKLRDEKGNLLPLDPKNYFRLEEKEPGFCAKGGLVDSSGKRQVSLTFRWSKRELVDMGAEALAHLVLDMREDLIEAWQKVPPTVVKELSAAEKLKEAAQRRRM